MFGLFLIWSWLLDGVKTIANKLSVGHQSFPKFVRQCSKRERKWNKSICLIITHYEQVLLAVCVVILFCFLFTYYMVWIFVSVEFISPRCSTMLQHFSSQCCSYWVCKCCSLRCMCKWDYARNFNVEDFVNDTLKKKHKRCPNAMCKEHLTYTEIPNRKHNYFVNVMNDVPVYFNYAENCF